MTPAYPIIPIIKAETLIPWGNYCYTPVQTPCAENGFRYKIRSCPFLERDHCRYLKQSDSILLRDQVKTCGVKDDPDEAALYSGMNV